MVRIFVIVVLAFCALNGVNAHARDARFFGSGWSTTFDEADVDDSMSGGAKAESSGWGSFGEFTAAATSDLADWDNASLCDFDAESGEARGIRLNYLAFTQVVRFARGDLMYLRMNSSPPSTLCFNFIDNSSFSFELHLDVVGGTGRFEGAAGRLLSRGTGSNVGAILSGFHAKTEGQIQLARD